MQSAQPASTHFAAQSNSPSGLHAAIIMDGNGRWAARRGLPRLAGHRAGVAAARRIVEHAPTAGIARLTLYAFSSDNWQRPTAEIQGIFWLLRAFLRLERERLRQAGARLQAIGRRDRIPKSLLREIEQAESATAACRRLHLRVAIDYSSRHAITRAAIDIARNATPPEDTLAGALTAEGGDVDLLIRTGGEKRLSDFLLWESAYAELFFTDRMWPDFGAHDLDAALAEFRNRERRFGGILTEPAPAEALR